MNDPIDEANRLLALQRSGLLDSSPEVRFDRITRLVGQFFSVKTCLISLVDQKRQWFKSRVGLDLEETDRTLSFCAHAILDNDIFVVQDATQDSRFSANLLVTGSPKIRFYAGAPIRDSDGYALGTLCIVDSRPRTFSSAQKRALRDFADVVEREIAQTDQFKMQRQVTANLTRTASILSTLPDMVFVIDREFRFLMCNEHPDLLVSRHKLLGRTVDEVMPGELGRQLTKNVADAFNTSEVSHHHYSLDDIKKTFEARYTKIDEREVLVIIRDTTEQTRVNAEIERLSEVAKQTTNGVVVTDDRGRVVWINESFTKITGYSIEEMVGRRPGDMLQGKDTDPETVDSMRKALRAQKSFNVDIVNYSKEGQPYWVRVLCNPMLADDGSLKGYIAIETDITKEKDDEEHIRQSDKLLKAVIDANTIGTWQLNLQTGELRINDKWAALLGYQLQELLPIDRSTWEKLTHPEDLAYCAQQFEQHADGRDFAYEANIRMKHKNGDWVWINTRGRVSSRTSDGKAEWLLGTHFDISAQIHAETTLKQKSTQMRAIVEHMLDGVVSIDQHGTVLTFNQAAEHIFGYSSDEIVGKNISLLMPTPHKERHDHYLSSYLLRGKGDVTGRVRELEGLHKNGTVFTMELGVVEVRQAEETNFVGIIRDITERKKREREINQLAYYDALTQLPNRRLLLDRIQHAIASCDRQNHYAALFFLDLDNFKNLNDSAGHDVGDHLLYRVAKRLSQVVRQSDTVARLGGDEFVVLVENLSVDNCDAAVQAQALAEKIMSEIGRSFDLNGLTYNCSASVGVTLFNNAESDSQELLKQADMAMYESKAAGRQTVCFYDPQMQVAVNLRLEIEQDLHEAIQNQNFKLYYQKQVDQTGRVVGTEVLLRWQHPSKGLISPAEFIPSAEQTGLIIPIGNWVLLEACRTLASWASDPRKADVVVAVNISVVQFSKQDLVQIVLNALEETGADPRKLKLEITESLLASNVPDVKAKMCELKRHGVSFSIDDFGTGYSSLAYLKQLPIDQLKIDQSFVRDILTSTNDRAIAQAVITLADSMGLSVIAEGVETHEQQALLLDMGCHAFQGYLFGKPIELERLEL